MTRHAAKMRFVQARLVLWLTPLSADERAAFAERLRDAERAVQAANSVLRAGGPDALGEAARTLTAVQGSLGHAWRRSLCETAKSHTVGMAIERAFTAAAAPVREELARLLAGRTGPEVKHGGYAFLCAACGADALSFTWTDGEGSYGTLSPVNKTADLDRERAAQVRGLLDAGRAREVIELLGSRAGPGFAQYCPLCDRVYCKDHVTVETVWSGSWHEATFATCPLGHHREFE